MLYFNIEGHVGKNDIAVSVEIAKNVNKTRTENKERKERREHTRKPTIICRRLSKSASVRCNQVKKAERQL